MSAPRRFSDTARRILFETCLEQAGTIARAVDQVRATTGEEIPPRSARGIVQRERLRREQATRDAAYATDPARAVEDLAARLFAVAARVVTREERRSSPDLVRLKRAASIVRELRPIVQPGGARASKPAPDQAPDNGHDSSESARLAAALEARSSTTPDRA